MNKVFKQDQAQQCEAWAQLGAVKRSKADRKSVV